MNDINDQVEVASRIYWFKIVDFLQQNWALIDRADLGIVVYFIGDTSGVFDELSFSSNEDAELALLRNGFNRFDLDRNAQSFIAVPQPPFYRQPHPNGPIYSSGRFLK